MGWTALRVLGLLGVAACGMPSPWRDAEPIDRVVEGWMRTAVDHPQPGAGWFRARPPGELDPEADVLEAWDFSQASVLDAKRAKDDVVVLQIGSVSRDGPTVLELDVALGAWVAGSVPVDGVASVGELRQPGGASRFVIGGTLEVRAAGARPGELVELSFSDLQLAEVP